MKTGLLGAAAAIVTLIPWQPAKATLGMLPQCVGTYNCGMGGAGLALGTDATSAVINPALGATMNNDAMLSVGWFSAQVKNTLNGNLANTVYKGQKQGSDASQFANGSLGVNYRLTPKWSANISVFPGGGGATALRDLAPRRAQGGAAARHLGGDARSRAQGPPTGSPGRRARPPPARADLELREIPAPGRAQGADRRGATPAPPPRRFLAGLPPAPDLAPPDPSPLPPPHRPPPTTAPPC